ncbi:MAG: hypothetical protein ACLTS6_12695 [Anaerobutyricum sp.]
MRSIGRIIAENRKRKGLFAARTCRDYFHSRALALQRRNNLQMRNLTNATKKPGFCNAFLTLCKLLDIEDIYDAYFGKNPYSVMDGLNQEGER